MAESKSFNYEQKKFECKNKKDTDKKRLLYSWEGVEHIGNKALEWDLSFVRELLRILIWN